MEGKDLFPETPLKNRSPDTTGVSAPVKSGIFKSPFSMEGKDLFPETPLKDRSPDKTGVSAPVKSKFGKFSLNSGGFHPASAGFPTAAYDYPPASAGFSTTGLSLDPNSPLYPTLGFDHLSNSGFGRFPVPASAGFPTPTNGFDSAIGFGGFPPASAGFPTPTNGFDTAIGFGGFPPASAGFPSSPPRSNQSHSSSRSPPFHSSRFEK